MMRKTLLWILACAPIMMWGEEYEVTSPNGSLVAHVQLVDGRLSYDVQRNGRTLVETSPLGLKAVQCDLTEGLQLVTSGTAQYDDAYQLASGKQHECVDRCNLLSVITERNGWRLTVQFRMYDDGFAYRYVVPKYGTHTSVSVESDESRLALQGVKSCVCSRFALGNDNYNYNYEANYGQYTWTQMLQPSDRRVCTPVLMQGEDEYLLVSEAANTSDFSASLLMPQDTPGTFAFSIAGENKDYATIKTQRVVCTLPARTPWRMVAVGTLDEVFRTTLPESLCPATEQKDLSWIQPGRAVWEWGATDGNKADYVAEMGGLEKAEYQMVDLAAEMGYEYTTIDGGWQESWVKDLIKYAHARGIKALLWSDAPYSELSNANMEATLKKWKQWGADGVKIDHWLDDSHQTMARMEKLLQLTGQQQMVVNLHGCIRPSGLRRTYPHLLSCEAVHGGENNFWDHRGVTAVGNIHAVLMRSVVGATDYTPGDFASYRGNLYTNLSLGHRMALLTAIESGLVHVADCPQNLQGFVGYEILKRIPADWDESRLLEGELGKYATVARRHGEDWWVSGITDGSRTCRLTLDFLEPGGDYTAYIYRDGSVRSELKYTRLEVAQGKSVNVPLLSGGGFLIQLSRNHQLEEPRRVDTYEAESTNNILSAGLTRTTGDALHTSGGSQVNNLGLGRSIQFQDVEADHDGQYMLTIYYAIRDDRTLAVKVNGETVAEQLQTWGNSAVTNSTSMDGASWARLPITLRKGENVVTLQSPAEGWSANIDRITIQAMDDGEQDAIAPLLTSPTEATHSYNLQGIPTTAAPGKIVIRNGKKFIRK